MWTQFVELMEQQNTDIGDWISAINDNPNDPAMALKTAILDQIIHTKSMKALEEFSQTIIELIQKAYYNENDNPYLLDSQELDRCINRLAYFGKN